MEHASSSNSAHKTSQQFVKIFSQLILYIFSFRWNLPLTGDKKTDDDIVAFANARQRILSQTHKCK